MAGGATLTLNSNARFRTYGGVSEIDGTVTVNSGEFGFPRDGTIGADGHISVSTGGFLVIAAAVTNQGMIDLACGSQFLVFGAIIGNAPVQAACLNIDEVTSPSGDPQPFGFTSALGNFSLTDAATPKQLSVAPGSTVSVTQSSRPDWDLTGLSCSDNSSQSGNTASVTLAAGQTVTCTFTNTKRAHLIIDKVTNPAGDPQSFGFTSALGNFDLTDSAAPKDFSVAPGSYSVTESATSAWALTGLSCSDNSAQTGSTASVTLAAGQTVTCTFTNTKLHPAIHVMKRADVTAAFVGSTVTYTFTVTNTGDTPLSSVAVIDPKCDTGTWSGPAGDANSDGKLDLSETWTYTCTHVVVTADGYSLHNVVVVNASGPGLPGPNNLASDTASADVQVIQPYKIVGFLSPSPNSKWKSGQTVPIKIMITDASGVRISDQEAAGLVSGTCRVNFSATGAQTQAPACMKYDSAAHQFIYNWKLGSKAGSETITVTISYPPTTLTTTKSETITITK